MSGIGFLVISQRSRVAQTGAALAPITRITYHGHTQLVLFSYFLFFYRGSLAPITRITYHGHTQLVLFSETHRSPHIIFKLSKSHVSEVPGNNREPTSYLYEMAAIKYG